MFLSLCLSVSVNGCGIDSGSNDEVAALEFITSCEVSTQSNDVILGIGNKDFVTIDSVEDVNIVQGYQGGFHLWGALRFASREQIDRTNAIQLVACLDGKIIADSSYESIAYLPRKELALYGLAIIFLPSIDVTQLGGRQINLIAAVQTDNNLHFSTASTSTRCCGHVADGD